MDRLDMKGSESKKELKHLLVGTIRFSLPYCAVQHMI